MGDQVYQPFKYQTASENNDKQLLFRRIEHNRAERHILSSSGATVKTMAGELHVCHFCVTLCYVFMSHCITTCQVAVLCMLLYSVNSMACILTVNTVTCMLTVAFCVHYC